MSSINLRDIQQKTKPLAAERTTASASISNLLNKDIQLFSAGFSDKQKEAFYSELNILFSAGVDIVSALELIENEQSKAKDKQLFATIKTYVIGGDTLSGAMSQTNMFSPYEIYSLQIGEESGQLANVLKEMSLFFSKKIQQKRQLISALSYPLIVFFASFGAIFFMMKFVVPMFADVFKRFKGELPYFTRVIIQVSDVFSAYAFYFIIVLLATILFLFYNRQKTWFRKYSAVVLLNTPVVKDLISKIYLARFCQSMNLLTGAKIPLITTIDLVQKMIGFYPIEISLETVRKDIMKGESLHASLGKFSIYNKRMISLIKVAEEVNQMDTMFSKLSQQYTQEVEHQTSLLSSLIEPIMIIFLGILVSVILVAMYLPLFQMGTTVG